MPDMNGLEVAHRMAEWQNEIFFIFATAYPGYALQAFELYSFDYILKPFDEERIKKTLRKLKNRLAPKLISDINANEIITIQSHGKTYLLKPEEILYVESYRANTLIKTLTDMNCIKGNLHTWEQQLAPYGFVQSHRSYLININQIKQICPYSSTYELILKSGDKVPLSRSYGKQLINILKRQK
jgi:DNA-binding LytR/AlgR family response regulator